MKKELKTTTKALIFLFTIASLLFSKGTAAQTSSTSGTDFWMGFTYAFQPNETGTLYKLSISSPTAATGTVSVPLGTFSAPFTLAANTTTVITIPYAQVQNDASESIQPKGVHIVSNNPVNVFGSMSQAVRTEAGMVIPTPLLGTEYYVQSYPGYWYGQSNFEVVATQNNTTIQITPTSQTLGNKPAGTTFNITLNAGQVYLVRANQGFTNAGKDDLTGTHIVGTDPCKPFAVFSGAGEVYLPTTCGTADPLYEELIPVSSWGTNYIVPPFFSSTGSLCRIVASQNNTQVTVDGGAPFNLNAGQFNEQSFNGNAHCISADKPIEVAQFMKGNACSGATPNKGDPDMIVINATTQMTKQVVFTPYNTFMAARYVNVVMKTPYIGQLTLDGTPVGAGSFTAAPCPGFSYATIPVTNAFHTLYADSGFVGSLYGYGSGDESYAINLGYSAPVATAANPTISGTATICPGGSATLTASGGGSYSWNTGATASSIVVSPSATATYTLNVTSGCGSGTTTATVTVGNSITASVSGNTTICPGANATLTASGGGSYSWNTGATASSITISPTATATYTAFVTAGTCSASATGTVTVGNNTTANVNGSTTICPGAGATLTASGGGNYSWNTGGSSSSLVVNPTGTSTYTVFVTVGTCSATATGTITVNNNITAGVGGNTSICPGGSSTLTASGGTGFSWNTGSSSAAIVVSPTSNATYSVIVSSGTCADTTSITVNVISTPTASVSPAATICGGSSHTLTASGGGTYSWSNGQTTAAITVNPTSNSTYSIIVTNAGGCTDIASTSITVNPSVNPTVTPSVICPGDSAVITASGGTAYSWNTGGSSSSITVSPSATASYTVFVTAGSCSATAVATVTVTTGITAIVSGNTSLCAGSSTTLTASGGTTFSWSNGQTSAAITLTPTGSATYSVIVSSGSCVDDTSITVNVTANPTATASSATICSGASATLTAGGGTSYSWSNNAMSSSITVSPSSTANYTVTVTNAGGCTGTAVGTIIVNSNPSASITGSSTICQGDAATLTASGGNNYSWSTGATGPGLSPSPTSTASYSVTVTNAAGCTGTASITVTVSPPPVANITGNTTICEGSSTALTATGGTNYSWSTGATTATINASPLVTTTYSVVTSIGSCTATASYTVTVQPIPTATAQNNVVINLGDNTTLTATGGGTYSWAPSTGLSCTNCSDPAASPEQTTYYCVFVTGPGGCMDSSCVTVTVELNCKAVYIPNAFSPNSDNENDVFMAYGNCIKEMKLIIYNRWGEKVYEGADPKGGWDGMYNGKLEDAAVFAFYFEYTLLDGKSGNKKGNVSLVR